MTEEVQSQSIQARIAALNLGHVGRAPITANGGRPDSGCRPALEERSHTISTPSSLQDGRPSIGNEPGAPKRNGVLPPPTDIVRTGQRQVQVGQEISKQKFTAPPRLPTRKSSAPSPALPPRKSLDKLGRKASNESLASIKSSTSTLSVGQTLAPHSRTPSIETNARIKAPAYDPSALPPLPPKRIQEEKEKPSYGNGRAKYAGVNATVKTTTPVVGAKPHSESALQADGRDVQISVPSLPPRRASKPEPNLSPRTVSSTSDVVPQIASRSALSYGMNKQDAHNEAYETNGNKGRMPSPSPPARSNGVVAPPIPIASRPDLSKIQSTKPRMDGQSQISKQLNGSASSCLLCRDFSAPDDHAAKFPRQSVPSLDWLAVQLTIPFANSPTDQARCIFVWLHHNIAYDTVAFFNNNVQPSTPSSTLSTGLAVCEGYAGLFTAIATKAGLESVVVGGHGKGYSFSALKPGDPIPAEYSTHAWNAVKIDNGEWKLIDSCWGAGHVNGKNQPYTKAFSPRMFTMSNEEFGLRHFPTNKSHFFRADGTPVRWEDYIVGEQRDDEPVRIYSGVAEREGLSERSIRPSHLHLTASPSHPKFTPTPIRFQFQHICAHWSPTRNGPGPAYVFILAIHGLDGREKDYLPFETNGFFWWLDVDPRRLGCAGQTVSLYTVETVGGESGRGLSVQQFREAKGRKGMSFGGVAAWELI